VVKYITKEPEIMKTRYASFVLSALSAVVIAAATGLTTPVWSAPLAPRAIPAPDVEISG
jgi:hypothetical protein